MHAAFSDRVDIRSETGVWAQRIAKYVSKTPTIENDAHLQMSGSANCQLKSRACPQEHADFWLEVSARFPQSVKWRIDRVQNKCVIKLNFKMESRNREKSLAKAKIYVKTQKVFCKLRFDEKFSGVLREPSKFIDHGQFPVVRSFTIGWFFTWQQPFNQSERRRETFVCYSANEHLSRCVLFIKVPQCSPVQHLENCHFAVKVKRIEYHVRVMLWHY